MEKQKLFGISAARKPEETKILLNERLLSQKKAATKTFMTAVYLLRTLRSMLVGKVHPGLLVD